MGKVKKKLPTPDTNPVDGDKLIKATKPKTFKESIHPIPTKPKKVKKTKEKPKKVKSKSVDINKLKKDLDNLGTWVADMDDDFMEIRKMVERLADRLGLE